MTFLKNVSLTEFGDVINKSKSKPYFDNKLMMFLPIIKKFRKDFSKEVFQSILNNLTQCYNLGMKILMIRDDFRSNQKLFEKYFDKDFLMNELSPKHFEFVGHGKRNICYWIKMSRVSKPVLFRKRLSNLDIDIIQKSGEPDFKEDHHSQNGYEEQHLLHDRLLELSVKVPRPIFGASHYQLMEYMKHFIPLIDYANSKGYVPSHPGRKKLEDQILEIRNIFNKHLFKQNDLHARNVLVGKTTQKVVIIDLDWAKFYRNKKEFEEPACSIFKWNSSCL